MQTFLNLKGFYEKSQSISERADKWFYSHLKSMNNPHQGMIILMIILPLYEKYLRANGLLDEDPKNSKVKFTKDHPVFTKIGNDFGVDKGTAYEFWWHCRNGLLHRAVIDNTENFASVLSRTGDAIKLDGDVFVLNPFAIRDRLLKLFIDDTKMWKADRIDLPAEYTFKATK